MREEVAGGEDFDTSPPSIPDGLLEAAGTNAEDKNNTRDKIKTRSRELGVVRESSMATLITSFSLTLIVRHNEIVEETERTKYIEPKKERRAI